MKVARITRDLITTESVGDCGTSDNVGARVVFEGVVRQKTGEVETIALEYDCHEPMALKALEAIEREASDRFQLKTVFIVHRVGYVKVGEVSIVVLVESTHRAEAFAGCAWLMDEVKKRVPIWKKDIGPQSEIWHHPPQGILKPPAPPAKSS